MGELIAGMGLIGVLVAVFLMFFPLIFMVYVMVKLSSIVRELDFANQQLKYYGEKLAPRPTPDPVTENG